MGDRRSVEEFTQLVEELADLEVEGTGAGGLSQDSAARRARVERRLMGLLSADVPADERRTSLRVPTNMTVTLHVGPSAAQARLVDLGVGGAFIEGGLAPAVGSDVVIAVERSRGAMDHSFQLRARVAWSGGRQRPGFGAMFVVAAEADERRLRRLVLQLLREYVAQSHG